MNCPECGVEEGQLHVPGCAVEECPACGGQMIDCKCDAMIHPDFQDRVIVFTHFGAQFPRQPWLNLPRVCMRCGKVNPDIFMVDNAEWHKYVPTSIRNQHLCRECYDEIKRIIDKAGK